MEGLFVVNIAFIVLVTGVGLCIVGAILFPAKRRALYSHILNEVHALYTQSKIFHAVGRIIADRRCPKGLPALELYERVSNRCCRVLGLNPGSHTLQGTNTWLIGEAETKILVDTGEDITCNDYISLLFDNVFPATGTKSLAFILLTHGHVDHQGGVVAILTELKKRSMLPLPKVYKRIVKNGDFPANGFECLHIFDEQLFSVSSCTIRAIYAPGHTDDHVAFVLVEDCALLSGDCILGCGTTVFDKLKPYVDSLKKLRELAIKFDSSEASSEKLCVPCNTGAPPAYVINKIYPGHGPVVHDALAKIDEYIEHRSIRERQILQALTEKDHPLTSWELVECVYPVLPFMVKFSAQRNVCHHLEKLLEENIVVVESFDLWSVRKR